MYNINASSGCTTQSCLRVYAPAISTSLSLPWKARGRKVSRRKSLQEWVSNLGVVYCASLCTIRLLSRWSDEALCIMQQVKGSCQCGKATPLTCLGCLKGHKSTCTPTCRPNRWAAIARIGLQTCQLPAHAGLIRKRCPLVADQSARSLIKVGHRSRSMSSMQCTDCHGRGVVKPVVSDLSECHRAVGQHLGRTGFTIQLHSNRQDEVDLQSVEAPPPTANVCPPDPVMLPKRRQTRQWWKLPCLRSKLAAQNHTLQAVNFGTLDAAKQPQSDY